MADTKYYWLKLYDDFFGSLRIKKLRKIAGGDTYTIIYLKMQLVAMKQGGILKYTGLEPTFAEELALDIDEESDNVAVTVNYLLNCGLLEQLSEREYFVPYAVANTGSESSSAKRVREHRERKALQCNAEVTPPKQLCNTEKEKEKETDIEIEGEIEEEAPDEPPPPPPLPPPDPEPEKPIDFGTLSPRMVSAVEEWLKYKKERRESYKPTGLRALITQLENNVAQYGEDAVRELIYTCMAANWRGIIFEKLKGRENVHTAPRKDYSKNDNVFMEMLNERRNNHEL